MRIDKNIILRGFPRNKDKYVRLIEFFKEILDICGEIDIHPVVDGSLAVFAYTRNKNIDINDIDLSISETKFPKIIRVLKIKGIKYRSRDFHVLEIIRNDLKVSFGSAEQWSTNLPTDYQTLQIDNHQVKMLSLAGLVKQYEHALNNRIEKVYGDACEGIKYLELRGKYKLLKMEKPPLITRQKIIIDPFLIASEHILKNGDRVLFRPLVKNDAIAFGSFLEGLKEETRDKFGPHSLTTKEAKNICNTLNYLEVLRLVLINTNQEIIGYMILSFLLRESQVLRYQIYKIQLRQKRDACIAPVIADNYQNSRAGSIMLEETIKIAHNLKIKYLILWQGVQQTNTRAIHYYEKFGFRKNGEFDRYGTHNIDMTLTLNNH